MAGMGLSGAFRNRGAIPTPSASVKPGAFHCADPDCDVVFVRFAEDNSNDTPDEVFSRDDIKDCAQPHATGRDKLVCYCFGYTAGEIEDDAASSASSVPSAIAAEVRAGNCACEVKNPAGH